MIILNRITNGKREEDTDDTRQTECDRQRRRPFVQFSYIYICHFVRLIRCYKVAPLYFHLFIFKEFLMYIF
jgi:hypothetical protein